MQQGIAQLEHVCMQYIRPQITTIAIAQAYGNACMLLAAGAKGRRAALPHAHIKMAPPRINRSYGDTVDVMIKANELDQNTSTYFQFMAHHTGKTEDQIRQDCRIDKYFSPEAAKEYGIIDQVITKQGRSKAADVQRRPGGPAARPPQVEDGPETAGA
jgi:ATP-dependent Clp protease protease subunit